MGGDLENSGCVVGFEDSGGVGVGDLDDSGGEWMTRKTSGVVWKAPGWGLGFAHFLLAKTRARAQLLNRSMNENSNSELKFERDLKF